MPDIVVTTPDRIMSEAVANAKKCKAAQLKYCHHFPLDHIPNIVAGDRVYYREEGYVIGYCIADSKAVFSQGIVCDASGMMLPAGVYVWMRADSWVWLMQERFMEFTGFIYADKCGIRRDTVEEVGDWLSPPSSREES